MSTAVPLGSSVKNHAIVPSLHQSDVHMQTCHHTTVLAMHVHLGLVKGQHSIALRGLLSKDSSIDIFLLKPFGCLPFNNTTDTR